MKKVLLATKNPGKITELQPLLDGLGLELLLPAAVGHHADVEETGTTYAENACLKAEALAQASGLVALGDDSGLEVDVLGGAPGVYSARYAGPGASDAQRRAKLVEAVRAFPEPRLARFRCVLAVAVPGQATRLFEGVCPGAIVLQARGQNGFGYDPIFFVPEYGCTMAELPPEVKNRISHRGRAVQAALGYLQTLA